MLPRDLPVSASSVLDNRKCHQAWFWHGCLGLNSGLQVCTVIILMTESSLLPQILSFLINFLFILQLLIFFWPSSDLSLTPPSWPWSIKMSWRHFRILAIQRFVPPELPEILPSRICIYNIGTPPQFWDLHSIGISFWLMRVSLSPKERHCPWWQTHSHLHLKTFVLPKLHSTCQACELEKTNNRQSCT